MEWPMFVPSADSRKTKVLPTLKVKDLYSCFQHCKDSVPQLPCYRQRLRSLKTFPPRLKPNPGLPHTNPQPTGHQKNSTWGSHWDKREKKRVNCIIIRGLGSDTSQICPKFNEVMSFLFNEDKKTALNEITPIKEDLVQAKILDLALKNYLLSHINHQKDSQYNTAYITREPGTWPSNKEKLLPGTDKQQQLLQEH